MEKMPLNNSKQYTEDFYNHPGYSIALDESGDFTNNKESLVMPHYTKVVIWKQSENRAKFSNVTKQIFHRGNAMQLSFDSKKMLPPFLLAF